MASSVAQGATLVQAIYPFKGTNNDELCFKKGDIITVTQKEEGGWWEGTLDGMTGWFPSNYVKEHKPQGVVLDGDKSQGKLPSDLSAQQKAYRNLVLKDLIDSEKANVAELKTLSSNFLHPLEKSEILNRDEYHQLVGNIDAIVEAHSKLLIALEACSELPPLEQRVGKLFLTSAPQIKQIHLSYCSSHPRSICILNKHKDALNTFMESQGAASPGLLVLTTGLSKPFRRLEKYSGILQEFERHIEENHPDRGDTQRSVSVYKDIWSACSAKRRQKEQELEILTGGVRGWEGEELSTLGEIIHMGSVAVGPFHRDRYLVLFPTTLLILSVSSRMSGFIYEGKLPLTGINVTQLTDTDSYKNAFEVTGNLIDKIVAVCQTKEDQLFWVDTLRQAIQSVRKSSTSSSQSNPSPHNVFTRTANKGLINKAVQGNWSLTSLKPLPPLRPSVELGKNGKTKSLSPKKSVDSNFEEDIQILRVIEAYCSNSKARSASTSGDSTSVPTTVDRQNGAPQVTVKERYIVESVDILRNQLTDLAKKVNTISRKLDEEIETRTVLQNSVKSKFSKLGNELDSS
ncbi:hypothetical protein RUM44_006973 [Polyplax serrata]|uniref:Rho guanine nucleotide exchange factor 7 n=1 Tax=Polyplax serrata TaxID=468196 RepID=A0ABR1AZF1_POLSC